MPVIVAKIYATPLNHATIFKEAKTEENVSRIDGFRREAGKMT